MSDPYAVFDELAETLDSVRRQQRLVVRLFALVLIAMLAGVVGLFYFTQDLPKETAVSDGRVRAVPVGGFPDRHRRREEARARGRSRVRRRRRDHARGRRGP